MTWPNGTRFQDAAPGGAWTPASMNGVQDQLLQVAGYRGKSVIATSESRTGTTYGTMTTPDQVTGIVLPADGLLMVHFDAVAKCSVANAGKWAIFLNGVQLKTIDGTSAAAVVQEAAVNFESNTFFARISTGGSGAVAGDQINADYAGDATTGQVAAGIGSTAAILAIEAAAGTYTVDVRFKATSGSVTVKNRSLRVWTEAFA